jgi:hypothetical protein
MMSREKIIDIDTRHFSKSKKKNNIFFSIAFLSSFSSLDARAASTTTAFQNEGGIFNLI